MKGTLGQSDHQTACPKGLAMARILVVDDNPSVRTTIRLMLETDGHSVILVENGRDGARAIEAEPIDLLIVDVFMPEMDGFELIQFVRKRNPDLPIIAISGSEAAPDFLAMARSFGAVRSIRKPFRPADLRDALRDCLIDRSPCGAVRH
jgi:CheY-like chemotaxis protein